MEENKNLEKGSDISYISEEAGAWRLLQERILELSDKRKKGAKDKPHWTMIHSLIYPHLAPDA